MKKRFIGVILAVAMLGVPLPQKALAVSEKVNVALGRHAWMSTDCGAAYSADKAVDGSDSTYCANGAPPTDGSPVFFAIDLGTPYLLEEIKVIGRNQTWGNGFVEQRDFQIELSNDAGFGEVTVVSGFDENRQDYTDSKTFAVNETEKYRYVRFLKDMSMDESSSKYNIGFVEVEVYTTLNLRNVAKNKITTVSSYASSVEGPGNVTDGDYTNCFANGAPPTDGSPVFATIDLEKPYTIDEIWMCGRNQNWGSGLVEQMDFKIQLSNDANFADASTVDITGFDKYAGQEKAYVSFAREVVTTDVKYQYIRFLKNMDDSVASRYNIGFKEVLIMSPDEETTAPDPTDPDPGDPSAEDYNGPLYNVAYGKEAWAGSWYSVGEDKRSPSKAVDGDWRTGYLNGGASSDTGYQYITVDLGQAYKVNKLRFCGRDADDWEQKNFKIQLSNDKTFNDATCTTDVTQFTDYQTAYHGWTEIQVSKLNRYRYIRFVKDWNITDGTRWSLCLNELLVLSPDKPQIAATLISEGKPVTHENEYTGQDRGHYAVDGDPNTDWFSGDSNSANMSYPYYNWLQVDLGENYKDYDITNVRFNISDRDWAKGSGIRYAGKKTRILLSDDPTFDETIDWNVLQIYNNTTTVEDNTAVPYINDVYLADGGLVYSYDGSQVVSERVPLIDKVNSYHYIRVESYERICIWELQVYARNLTQSLPAPSLGFYSDENCTVSIGKTIPENGKFYIKLNGVNYDNNQDRIFDVYVAKRSRTGALDELQHFEFGVGAWLVESKTFEVNATKGPQYDIYLWERGTLKPLVSKADMQ